MDNQNYKDSIKISFISIIINIILSVFKFIAGVIGNSSAMVSDSIHSLSDVISTVSVIIGINVSNKESDESHPFGHERFESISALFLGFLLVLTAIFIGYEGFSKIIIGLNGNIVTPSLIALVAAIISIVSKEIMYHVTKKVALKSNSEALMADAWHHRSDALSSVGSLIGISLARIGFPIFDPIFSLIICLIILKVGIYIIKEAILKLVDKSCDKILENKFINTILEIEGVMSLDLIRTRIFGSKIYVEVEIGADKNQTLENSHKIATEVHDTLENNFNNIKHCMVHVNPK